MLVRALVPEATLQFLDPGLLRLDDFREHRDDIHRAEARTIPVRYQGRYIFGNEADVRL